MPAKWKGKGLRTFATLLTALIALAAPAQAENDRAGVFDYYVLALSWSPSWCALEGDAREAAQCAPGKGLGFTLHGLWPQHERGWPDYCRSDKSDPSRRQSGAMADIMGDGGLAWHQWKKHGRCSGLSAEAYFDLSRRAYASVVLPPVLSKLAEPIRVDPKVIERAFLEVNPDMAADGVTVTCKQGRISEVRICLTKSLEPRACGVDTLSDCAYPADISPIRRAGRR
jgi:ribonuclease T2